jgi:acyl-CoA thioester hydrolase
MKSDDSSLSIPTVHELMFRVRYQETDAQGRVYHGNYANYFEMGRVEMLRAGGINYRDLESSGLMLVVVSLSCRFYLGAQYDDLLKLVTRVTQSKGVRMTHHYQLFRENELLVEGETVIAAVNREGKVVRMPRHLRLNLDESPES